MKTSESIKNIIPALLKAQKSIEQAEKNAKNPFFKKNYADLGSIMSACKTQLNENDIVALQPIMCDKVETTLIHISGEWITSETTIKAKNENDPQAYGSAVTYARRYGLQSLVFISAEDDDGNKAQIESLKKKMWAMASNQKDHKEKDKFLERAKQLYQVGTIEEIQNAIKQLELIK